MRKKALPTPSITYFAHFALPSRLAPGLGTLGAIRDSENEGWTWEGGRGAPGRGEGGYLGGQEGLVLSCG